MTEIEERAQTQAIFAKKKNRQLFHMSHCNEKKNASHIRSPVKSYIKISTRSLDDLWRIGGDDSISLNCKYESTGEK